jgi:RNA polymerase sigma-70 factor (ECF subfamily)
MSDQKYLDYHRKHFNFDTSSDVNNADFEILSQELEEIIVKLPRRRKEIYKLSREKGMSYSEIANELDISVKTVETQVGLALKYIRSALSDKNLTVLLFFALFC